MLKASCYLRQFFEGKILKFLKLYHKFQSRIQNKALHWTLTKLVVNSRPLVKKQCSLSRRWDKMTSGGSFQSQLFCESDTHWVHQYRTQFLPSIWSLETRLSHAPRYYMWMLLVWVLIQRLLNEVAVYLSFRTAEWLVKSSKDIGDLILQHWDSSLMFNRQM